MAPGGTIAFNAPTGIKRWLAAILGETADAAMTGTSSVGAGVTVNLIQIDATGAQVGQPIATATTDVNGAFSLSVPSTFVPGPQYVVRAVGTSSNMDAMVTATTVNVDPSTQATEQLVLGSVTATGVALASVNPASVAELQNEVNQVVLDAGGISTQTTASGMASAIVTASGNSETVSNMASSLAQSGVIQGQVTDTSGNPLADIQVIARDYNNWVTRAATHTDANGNYSLSVPPNRSYIVSAQNLTANAAASAWWSSACSAACNVANQFSAGKITVAGTPVTASFKLPAGASISGVVTGGSAPLAGIRVFVRDFTNDEPVVGTHTAADGSFRLHLLPGTYTVSTVNDTASEAYAGIYYPAGASAGTDSTQALPISLPAGGSQTLNFALPAGNMISGVVTDPATSPVTPVSGISVRIYGTNSYDSNPGTFVQALRTDLAGHYQIWLTPGQYVEQARGQNASVNTTTASVTQDFTAAVGTVTATITDGTNPMSQAKLTVYDSTGSTKVGFEVSNADGTVSLYAPSTANYLVELKLDGGQTSLGSSIYLGQTHLTAGTLVPFAVGATSGIDGSSNPPTPPSVALPSGGELKGTVTMSGSLVGNAIVQVRMGGTTGAYRFVATRTQSDGSYSISLPAGTYNRVCAIMPGSAPSTCPGSGTGSGSVAGSYAFQDSVAVAANQSNTQNFVF